MSSLRLATTRSQAPRLTIRNTRIQPLSSTHLRLANQDYGSGAGDPKGERPQEQGKNPMEHKEHPGPPPPKTSDKTDKPQGGQQGGQGEKKG